jgi:hypothetical protein
LQILREHLETHEKVYLTLDIAVKELKIYDMGFYERYFGKGGIWLTEDYKYEKSDN